MAAITIRAVLLAAVTAVGGCSIPAPDQQAPPPAGRDCLAPATWYRFDHGRAGAVSGAQVLQWAARQTVVLLGETHTSADDHRWQLQTLAALHLLHPNMVIGFEAFPRRVQPVLDDWVAGRLGVDQFLKRSQWQEVWNYPAELYLPLFHFARINRIPMIALNVDLSLPRAVRKHGWQAVPAAAKQGISRPAPPPEAYVDMLYDVFKQHAFARDSDGISKTDPRFRHFVQAQTTWDRAMAEALAAQVQSGKGGRQPLVVGIMGAGHVRHGYGVPYQLHDLGIDEVAVLLPVDGGRSCQSFAPGYADAVFVLPDHPADAAEKQPPPRLGVRLMAVHGNVRIVDVVEGSLAQETGFKPGDVIVAIGGATVHGMAMVVEAIRTQPPATPLPIEIRRGDRMLELVVEFPAKQ